MVGLVLVSHSETLILGLREMAAQMAGPHVPIVVAGGTLDHRLGTSAPLVEDALRTALAKADEVLVLLDLGSAVLSIEVALGLLEPAERARVRITDAPLVEGAVLAAVEASLGSSLDEVARVAEQAAHMPKLAGLG